MESVTKDAQPSVISEPVPSTSNANIDTSTESVAAQTNTESQNFDRYADDWDTSSSDEFDSEFDTDKEGKASSSSTGKGASESLWKKVSKKKESVDLQTESGQKSNDRPEPDDNAVHVDSTKLNVKTAEAGSDKNEESPVDRRDKSEEKSEEVKHVSNGNKDTSSDKKPSGDVKHEVEIRKAEQCAKVNTDSVEKVQNSIKTAPVIEKHLAKLEESVNKPQNFAKAEHCAKVKTESMDKAHNSIKTTPVTEELGNKSKVEEAPKGEGTSTNVQKRPIPIIIVKPPPSPDDMQSGEEYEVKPENVAR